MYFYQSTTTTITTLSGTITNISKLKNKEITQKCFRWNHKKSIYIFVFVNCAACANARLHIDTWAWFNDYSLWKYWRKFEISNSIALVCLRTQPCLLLLFVYLKVSYCRCSCRLYADTQYVTSLSLLSIEMFPRRVTKKKKRHSLLLISFSSSVLGNFLFSISIL